MPKQTAVVTTCLVTQLQMKASQNNIHQPNRQCLTEYIENNT